MEEKAVCTKASTFRKVYADAQAVMREIHAQSSNPVPVGNRNCIVSARKLSPSRFAHCTRVTHRETGLR